MTPAHNVAAGMADLPSARVSSSPRASKGGAAPARQLLHLHNVYAVGRVADGADVEEAKARRGSAASARRSSRSSASSGDGGLSARIPAQSVAAVRDAVRKHGVLELAPTPLPSSRRPRPTWSDAAVPPNIKLDPRPLSRSGSPSSAYAAAGASGGLLRGAGSLAALTPSSSQQRPFPRVAVSDEVDGLRLKPVSGSAAATAATAFWPASGSLGSLAGAAEIAHGAPIGSLNAAAGTPLAVAAARRWPPHSATASPRASPSRRAAARRRSGSRGGAGPGCVSPPASPVTAAGAVLARDAGVEAGGSATGAVGGWASDSASATALEYHDASSLRGQDRSRSHSPPAPVRSHGAADSGSGGSAASKSAAATVQTSAVPTTTSAQSASSPRRAPQLRVKTGDHHSEAGTPAAGRPPQAAAAGAAAAGLVPGPAPASSKAEKSSRLSRAGAGASSSTPASSSKATPAAATGGVAASEQSLHRPPYQQAGRRPSTGSASGRLPARSRGSSRGSATASLGAEDDDGAIELRLHADAAAGEHVHADAAPATMQTAGAKAAAPVRQGDGSLQAAQAQPESAQHAIASANRYSAGAGGQSAHSAHAGTNSRGAGTASLEAPKLPAATAHGQHAVADGVESAGVAASRINGASAAAPAQIADTRQYSERRADAVIAPATRPGNGTDAAAASSGTAHAVSASGTGESSAIKSTADAQVAAPADVLVPDMAAAQAAGGSGSPHPSRRVIRKPQPVSLLEVAEQAPANAAGSGAAAPSADLPESAGWRTAVAEPAEVSHVHLPELASTALLRFLLRRLPLPFDTPADERAAVPAALVGLVASTIPPPRPPALAPAGRTPVGGSDAERAWAARPGRTAAAQLAEGAVAMSTPRLLARAEAEAMARGLDDTAAAAGAPHAHAPAANQSVESHDSLLRPVRSAQHADGLAALAYIADGSVALLPFTRMQAEQQLRELQVAVGDADVRAAAITAAADGHRAFAAVPEYDLRLKVPPALSFARLYDPAVSTAARRPDEVRTLLPKAAAADASTSSTAASAATVPPPSRGRSRRRRRSSLASVTDSTWKPGQQSGPTAAFERALRGEDLHLQDQGAAAAAAAAVSVAGTFPLEQTLAFARWWASAAAAPIRTAHLLRLLTLAVARGGAGGGSAGGGASSDATSAGALPVADCMWRDVIGRRNTTTTVSSYFASDRGDRELLLGLVAAALQDTAVCAAAFAEGFSADAIAAARDAVTKPADDADGSGDSDDEEHDTRLSRTRHAGAKTAARSHAAAAAYASQMPSDSADLIISLFRGSPGSGKADGLPAVTAAARAGSEIVLQSVRGRSKLAVGRPGSALAPEPLIPGGGLALPSAGLRSPSSPKGRLQLRRASTGSPLPLPRSTTAAGAAAGGSFFAGPAPTTPLAAVRSPKAAAAAGGRRGSLPQVLAVEAVPRLDSLRSFVTWLRDAKTAAARAARGRFLLRTLHAGSRQLAALLHEDRPAVDRAIRADAAYGRPIRLAHVLASRWYSDRTNDGEFPAKAAAALAADLAAAITVQATRRERAALGSQLKDAVQALQARLSGAAPVPAVAPPQKVPAASYEAAARSTASTAAPTGSSVTAMADSISGLAGMSRRDARRMSQLGLTTALEVAAAMQERATRGESRGTATGATDVTGRGGSRAGRRPGTATTYADEALFALSSVTPRVGVGVGAPTQVGVGAPTQTAARSADAGFQAGPAAAAAASAATPATAATAGATASASGVQAVTSAELTSHAAASRRGSVTTSAAAPQAASGASASTSNVARAGVVGRRGSNAGSAATQVAGSAGSPGRRGSVSTAPADVLPQLNRTGTRSAAMAALRGAGGTSARVSAAAAGAMTSIGSARSGTAPQPSDGHGGDVTSRSSGSGSSFGSSGSGSGSDSGRSSGSDLSYSDDSSGLSPFRKLAAASGASAVEEEDAAGTSRGKGTSRSNQAGTTKPAGAAAGSVFSRLQQRRSSLPTQLSRKASVLASSAAGAEPADGTNASAPLNARRRSSLADVPAGSLSTMRASLQAAGGHGAATARIAASATRSASAVGSEGFGGGLALIARRLSVDLPHPLAAAAADRGAASHFAATAAYAERAHASRPASGAAPARSATVAGGFAGDAFMTVPLQGRHPSQLLPPPPPKPVVMGDGSRSPKHAGNAAASTAAAGAGTGSGSPSRASSALRVAVGIEGGALSPAAAASGAIMMLRSPLLSVKAIMIPVPPATNASKASVNPARASSAPGARLPASRDAAVGATGGGGGEHVFWRSSDGDSGSSGSTGSAGKAAIRGAGDANSAAVSAALAEALQVDSVIAAKHLAGGLLLLSPTAAALARVRQRQQQLHAKEAALRPLWDVPVAARRPSSAPAMPTTRQCSDTTESSGGGGRNSGELAVTGGQLRPPPVVQRRVRRWTPTGARRASAAMQAAAEYAASVPPEPLISAAAASSVARAVAAALGRPLSASAAASAAAKVSSRSGSAGHTRPSSRSGSAGGSPRRQRGSAERRPASAMAAPASTAAFDTGLMTALLTERDRELLTARLRRPLSHKGSSNKLAPHRPRSAPSHTSRHDAEGLLAQEAHAAADVQQLRHRITPLALPGLHSAATAGRSAEAAATEAAAEDVVIPEASEAAFSERSSEESVSLSASEEAQHPDEPDEPSAHGSRRSSNASLKAGAAAAAALVSTATLSQPVLAERSSAAARPAARARPTVVPPQPPTRVKAILDGGSSGLGGSRQPLPPLLRGWRSAASSAASPQHVALPAGAAPAAAGGNTSSVMAWTPAAIEAAALNDAVRASDAHTDALEADIAASTAAQAKAQERLDVAAGLALQLVEEVQRGVQLLLATLQAARAAASGKGGTSASEAAAEEAAVLAADAADDWTLPVPLCGGACDSMSQHASVGTTDRLSATATAEVTLPALEAGDGLTSEAAAGIIYVDLLRGSRRNQSASSQGAGYGTGISTTAVAATCTCSHWVFSTAMPDPFACAAAVSSTTLALAGGVPGDASSTSEAGDHDVVLRDGTSDLRAEAADVLWLAAEEHRAKLRMRTVARDASQAAAARADRLRWAAMSPSQREAALRSRDAVRGELARRRRDEEERLAHPAGLSNSEVRAACRLVAKAVAEAFPAWQKRIDTITAWRSTLAAERAALVAVRDEAVRRASLVGLGDARERAERIRTKDDEVSRMAAEDAASAAREAAEAKVAAERAAVLEDAFMPFSPFFPDPGLRLLHTGAALGGAGATALGTEKPEAGARRPLSAALGLAGHVVSSGSLSIASSAAGRPFAPHLAPASASVITGSSAHMLPLGEDTGTDPVLLPLLKRKLAGRAPHLSALAGPLQLDKRRSGAHAAGSASLSSLSQKSLAVKPGVAASKALSASSHASTASALDLRKGQLPTSVTVAGPLRAGREGPAFVALQRPVLAPVYSLSSSGST